MLFTSDYHICNVTLTWIIFHSLQEICNIINYHDVLKYPYGACKPVIA